MSDKWTVVDGTANAERKIYVAKDRNSRIGELAKIVELEVKDFKYWGKVLKWGTYTKIVRRKSGGKVKATKIRVKYPHTVSVPNVWVAVDALRGGTWYYDRPIVNPGGSLGMFFGTDLFTSGKKVEKFRTIKDLMTFLKNPQKRENVWGMVLFAHGKKSGSITEPSEDTTSYSQIRIIYELRKNKYRLAKAYLMQCYSGYKGKVNIRKQMQLKDLKKSIRQHFQYIKNLKIEEDKTEKGYYKISFDIDWKAEWGSVVAKEPYTYQDMNILMIDLDIFLRWL